MAYNLKMSKLICVIFVILTKADAEVLEVSKIKEPNPLTICLSDKLSCDGVLLAEKWVMVRASCVFPKRPGDLLIFEQGEASCDYYDLKILPATRRATTIYNHPDWNRDSSDLALIVLDRPYEEQKVNSHFGSEDNDILQKHELWINEIILSHTDVPVKTQNDFQPRALQNPGKTFLLAIVLPTIAFAVFFVYFIFYTGSNESCIKKDSGPIGYEKLEVSA